MYGSFCDIADFPLCLAFKVCRKKAPISPQKAFFLHILKPNKVENCHVASSVQSLNKNLESLWQVKVLATLVNLVFSIPHLDWDNPGQHLETFAGDCQVTQHEWMDRFAKRYGISMLWNGTKFNLGLRIPRTNCCIWLPHPVAVNTGLLKCQKDLILFVQQ